MLLASQATHVLDVLSFVSTGIAVVLLAIGLFAIFARSRSRHSDDHPASPGETPLPDPDAKTLSELFQVKIDRASSRREDGHRKDADEA
jgi:hypothetical protein